MIWRHRFSENRHVLSVRLTLRQSLHQVTSLLTVPNTFTEKLTFFQKFTTPLIYSIKNQKLKNHRITISAFFLAYSLKIAARKKKSVFLTSFLFQPCTFLFLPGHREVRFFFGQFWALVWTISPEERHIEAQMAPLEARRGCPYQLCWPCKADAFPSPFFWGPKIDFLAIFLEVPGGWDFKGGVRWDRGTGQGLTAAAQLPGKPSSIFRLKKKIKKPPRYIIFLKISKTMEIATRKKSVGFCRLKV